MSSSRQHSTARRHSDPGNTSWQLPGNSRCIKCNQFAASCTCDRNSNLSQDSVSIKAALDQVASNTLFGRMKAQRVYEQLFSQEESSRKAVWGERHRFLQWFQQAFSSGQKLVDLQETEQFRRHHWLHSFRREYVDLEHTFFVEWKLAMLLTHEREIRRDLQQQQFIQFERVQYLFEMEHDIVSLVFKEASARFDVDVAESESAYRFHHIHDHLRREADRFLWDCKELERVYLAIRQEITYECSSSYRMLMNAHSSSSRSVMEQIEARARFLDNYNTSLRDLEVVERTARTEIRRDFFSELHELEAMLELHGEERKRFANNESAIRGGVRSEESARFRALCDFEVQCREAIQEQVATRAQERAKCLEEAVADLKQIIHIERNDRERLLQREEQDRDFARQLTAEKALARQRLAQEASRFLVSVENEESTERAFIMQRMTDNVVLVEIRVENNATERLAFCVSETDARLDVERQREADLTAARLAMEERETQIFRLLASRHAQRINVEDLESSIRLDLETHESEKRAFILSECERMRHVCDKHLEHQREEITSFMVDAKSAFQVLGNEEESEFEELQVLFNAELDTVRAAELDRISNELFDAERRFRHKGTIYEFEERQQILSWFQSSMHEAARAEQDRASECLTMLEMEESAARDWIRREFFGSSEEVAAWGDRSERAALAEERMRLQQERFEREQALQEEATNPELFEPLMVSGRLSLGEVRRSVSLAPSSDRDLKVNYLSQLLRRDDIGNLNDCQVDFLAAVLERSAQWRAEKENNEVAMEARMRAREKDLIRAETLERSRCDAADHYRKKLEEEQIRQERTIENEKGLVQKAKKQAKIEELRANEMESILKKRTQHQEQVRDQIHSRLGRK